MTPKLSVGAACARMGVLLVLAAFTCVKMALAEPRYALVIGNGSYKRGPLSSPLLGAPKMAEKLANLGYQVTQKTDLKRDELISEINEFGKLLKKPSATGFFYYSGHGMQIKGRNYLIPIDSAINGEVQIENFYGVQIELVLATMHAAKSKPNIIVIDACRDNRFEKSYKGGPDGMAAMESLPGTLIAFAAASGKTARQRENALSVFTQELVQRIDEPGVPILTLFQSVQNAVYEVTNGEQEPHLDLSPGLPNFVFREPRPPRVVENSSAKKDVEIGNDYWFGRNGRNQSPSEALGWYRSAAEKGDALGQASLGGMYASGLGGLQKDDTEAVKWLRQAAEQGNAEGQNYLGLMYMSGRGGLPKDDIEAAKWYSKAAKQGSASAQTQLGIMYEDSRGGLPKDDAEAVKWYRKAVEQGNADAKAKLGKMYARGGGGLPKDEAEAVKWYREAADQGNSWGQAYLAGMYAEGLGGLPKDGAEAAKLYRNAAEQGNDLASVSLGLIYVNGGPGLPKDFAEAVKWTRKVVEQFNGDVKVQAEAQLTIALLYTLGGFNLPKDEVEAAKWFRKAAEQGNAVAQSHLGVKYASGGSGLKKDDAEAVKWFLKAAKQGDITAQDNLRSRGITW